MIVTYLARLMLLLPELSPADATHLQQVAQHHQQQAVTSSLQHRHPLRAREEAAEVNSGGVEVNAGSVLTQPTVLSAREQLTEPLAQILRVPAGWDAQAHLKNNPDSSSSTSQHSPPHFLLNPGTTSEHNRHLPPPQQRPDGLPGPDCIPINETLRKHLIQVSGC